MARQQEEAWGAGGVASSTLQTGDVSSSWLRAGSSVLGSRSVLPQRPDSEQDRKAFASLVERCYLEWPSGFHGA